MSEERRDNTGQVALGWLEGHTPASVPYIIGFSIFIPVLLASNIALEFWLDRSDLWLTNLRDGLLNAGVMATWGIPLTIILTEVVTKMLARSYIAKREKEATARLLRHQEEMAAQRAELESQNTELESRREESAAQREELVARREELAARREELVAQREESVTRREELTSWYAGQIAKWEERKRQAEADGKDFTEPMPEPPPGINTNGHVS